MYNTIFFKKIENMQLLRIKQTVHENLGCNAIPKKNEDRDEGTPAWAYFIIAGRSRLRPHAMAVPGRPLRGRAMDNTGFW